jgi:hypothetical protein
MQQKDAGWEGRLMGKECQQIIRRAVHPQNDRELPLRKQ